jgi:hypothetical protein
MTFDPVRPTCLSDHKLRELLRSGAFLGDSRDGRWVAE